MAGTLTVEELSVEVAAGRIDTVVPAIADMQGRLQGERLSARHFLDEVARHGAEDKDKTEAEDEAVRVAKDTRYGLSGSIWTRNMGRALRVARAVEAGALSVDSHSSVRYWTPFGGCKESVLGRTLGPDALAVFSETKNVFISDQ
ncbi:Aldehyde dehydrogenase family protein [Sinosporangium album]|uniref:Aldehyde dehydrogenase family protein n=1 Tax=Sinosporangium album TaxID=504805 RepID=A0A1G7V891_9ACTN|nr:Aldehyde dehydrogenase family protein [Sinosporangium album]